MVKAIIFDWHGVLDKIKFEDLIDKIVAIKNAPKDSINQTLREYGNDYASGKLSSGEFWSELQSKFSLTDTVIRDLKFHILRISLNYELWSQLNDLKNKYALAILSDCPSDKAEIIRKNTNLSLFKAVTFSSDVGLTKGSIHFFNNILTKLDLPTEDCLYVDDSEKNILFASKIGFKTCLYRTLNDLKVALCQ